MPVRRSRPRSPTGRGDGRSIVSESQEPLDMNDMLDPNKMAEATRLTRAGG
jgi:hypothetical protein